MRGENAKRTKRARALRQVENEAEDVLWQELRGRRLNGWSVLRVWHFDVLRDRGVVLDMVVAAAEGRMVERMISSEARFLPASRQMEP